MPAVNTETVTALTGAQVERRERLFLALLPYMAHQDVWAAAEAAANRIEGARGDVEQIDAPSAHGPRWIDASKVRFEVTRGPAGVIHPEAASAISDAYAQWEQRQQAQFEQGILDQADRNGNAPATTPKRFAVTLVWQAGGGQVMTSEVIEAGTSQEAVGLGYERKFQGHPLVMATAVDVDEPDFLGEMNAALERARPNWPSLNLAFAPPVRGHCGLYLGAGGVSSIFIPADPFTLDEAIRSACAFLQDEEAGLTKEWSGKQ